MKKMLGVLLSCILILGFTGAACADAAGTYLLDSFSDGELTMDREDILAAGLDWSIVLAEDGVAQVRFDHPITGTWLDGVITVAADGETETLPYTIEEDALAIDLDGEIATFRREDGATQATTQPEEPSREAATPLQQWWAGDWYGYWTVSGVTDRYDALDDGRWDCYATVALANDGSGSIHVWDAEETLFEVSVTVSETSGSGAMGAAISEGGSYGDGAAIEHADMIIDPSLYGYDGYMVIDGYHESADDPDEGYYFWVYLRPWGQLWDDIPEDSRPPQYAEWYLERYGLPFDELWT
ncbi:hypothetical protein LJC74_02930 [Eubacteriales bacterium OttesenSCG-928-A19]|nr:hypothetical protein [Eubacteriales bacterium OttesenSCG-928-A19]